MPRKRKIDEDDGPNISVMDAPDETDVPDRHDKSPPAWIDRISSEVGEMLWGNLPQIEACAATNPDSKVKVSLIITLDMLELEGFVHTLKMRYAARPFVDERVVSGDEREE